MPARTKRKKKKFVKKILRRSKRVLSNSPTNEKRIENMTKNFLILACIMGAAAVILGAFGAHILGKVLSLDEIRTYQTGVQYHFYHTFALILSALLNRYTHRKWARISGWLFVAGIVFFSGSLYLLATADAFDLGAIKPFLGPITPLGGICFISGWITLSMAAMSYKGKTSSHHHHRRSSSHSSAEIMEDADLN